MEGGHSLENDQGLSVTCNKNPLWSSLFFSRDFSEMMRREVLFEAGFRTGVLETDGFRESRESAGFCATTAGIESINFATNGFGLETS